MPSRVPVPLGEPRRTSPWVIVFQTVSVLAGFVFLAVSAADRWALLQTTVFGVSGLVALILRWRFRTYTVTAERLLLDEGVLRRRERVMPFARVQQVNVSQGVLFRVLGLATLYVENAGEGGSSTVNLFLARPDAEALRAYVLDRRGELSVQAEVGERGAHAAPSPRQLGTTGAEELLLAGVTHTGVLITVVVALALVGPVVAVLLLDGRFGPGDGFGWPGSLIGAPLMVLVTAAVLGGVAASVSVVATLVRDWKWTLTETGNDLEVRRGLLAVRSQSWPRQRVQRVTVVDNPVRRRLGRVSVLLHTAAAPGSEEPTVVQVPLARRDRLDELLTLLMGSEWALPPLEPRPVRARLRAVRRRAVVILAAVAVPLVWQPGVLWVLMVWIVLAWPWGRAAHGRAGAAVTTELVVLASGVVHHRIDLAPRRRVQSTRTSASPLQRHRDLATVHLDLAGTARRAVLRPAPRHFDADAARAEELRRQLAR